MCGFMEGDCVVKEAVVSIIGDAIENVRDSVIEAYGQAAATLGTMWVNVGTPNLSVDLDSASANGQTTTAAGVSGLDTGGIETVLGYVSWIALAVAIISIFILGGTVATRVRAGEGVAAVGRLGIVLSAVVLVSGATALISKFMPAGPTNAAGATLFLQSSLWWYMGVAAVASVIIGGARMIWEQRAEPGRETLKSLLTLIVVAGSGVTIVALLVQAADAFSIWVINGSLGCNVLDGVCFQTEMGTLIVLTAMTPLGALLVIILGIIAILASVFQIVLMVARGGLLVILTGILPLAASATNTEMGKAWFKKCVGWLIAFILYKPAAAIVYAAAFQLAGSGVFVDDGSGLLSLLTGLMLMIIALFALPALMRFVTPMVGAVAGGGGAALAGAALGSLPSGAAAVGRMASGSGSGGGSGAGGPSGQDGNSGSPGSDRPSGNATGGQSTSKASQSAGAQDAGAGVPGPSAGGGAGSAAGKGAVAGGGGGAAGGAAAGGGAAAAGGGAAAGGAAAGAAAGPVGIAAGVALSAAKKGGEAAAGAAASIGAQSTGEGDGPHGSNG